MEDKDVSEIFTQNFLDQLFPSERTNEFFDALFGDADEGAYDISLGYQGFDGDKLMMELQLKQRPGHCLACNLTQGLPAVFSRHPIINIQGLVDQIDSALDDTLTCSGWNLGNTIQKSSELHVIPLTVEFAH